MTIPMTFAGHHIEITDAIKQHAIDKLKKLENFGEHITQIRVTFEVEKLRNIAKATLHVKGAEINASEESADMYAAIDGLAHKLERQIKKHRDGNKNHS